MYVIRSPICRPSRFGELGPSVQVSVTDPEPAVIEPPPSAVTGNVPEPTPLSVELLEVEEVCVCEVTRLVEDDDVDDDADDVPGCRLIVGSEWRTSMSSK